MLLADLATGQVLDAEEPTRIWHPASITKLMTVRVALAQVRAGKLTMETRLVASPEAARARPSKIGIKPGESLTLRDALRLLMVKSANDVAIMVAEHVGGSVEGFAEMMNREAAELGMRESRFVNPHGFAAPGHRSSARDMAVLARRLLLDFPEHRDLFSIGALKLDDTVMENTNGIIGRYPGATGMKTGFVCASGFNVVATARRDGRELIVVVLGSPAAAERTLRTMTLFDAGFARGSRGPTLEQLPSPGQGDPPDMREVICGGRAASMGENSDPAPVSAAASSPAEGAASAPVLASAETAAPQRARLGPRETFTPLAVTIHRPPPVPPAAKVAQTAQPAAKPAPAAANAERPAAKPAAPDAAKKAEAAKRPETPRGDDGAARVTETRPTAAARPAETPRPSAPAKPAEKPAAPAKPAPAAPAKPAPVAAEKPPVERATAASEEPPQPSGGMLNLPPRNPALSDRSR